jgi:hypothetical protein
MPIVWVLLLHFYDKNKISMWIALYLCFVYVRPYENIYDILTSCELSIYADKYYIANSFCKNVLKIM